MDYIYTSYVLPLFVATLISSWALFYAWIHRETKGVIFVVALAVGVIAWTFGYALEIAGANLEIKLFWGKIQYFGITIIPAAWLLFALTYTNQLPRVTPRMLAALSIMPVITLLLTFTTEQHHLVWSEYEVFQPGAPLKLGHGLWFWVNWAYSQLLVLAGVVAMTYFLMRSKGMFRGQGALWVIAAFAPWIGNILSIWGGSPLDLTPFAFTISVVFLLWAVFGFRFGNIAPLARDLVVDSMRDGMIVLGMRGNIIDINNAAARMIGVPVSNAIGKTAGEIFSPWPNLVERFRDVMEANDVISVGKGEAERRYAMRLSPLQDQQGQMVGRIIMLHMLDEDAPPPRFARSAASHSDTRPLSGFETRTEDTENRAAKKQIPIWSALVNFYYAPTQKDIAIPPNINPVWHQTRERIFTIILRIAASVRTAALIITAFVTTGTGITDYTFAVIVVLLWVLGVKRDIKFELRTGVFLALIYSLGFIEIVNYGLSVQSIVFFMTLTVVSAVLTSRRGALHALASGFVTLAIFTILIGSGRFIPFAVARGGESSLNIMIPNLLIFAIGSSTVLAFIVTLLENLNNAWQKETQALNLLQQERDLLEQRVKERTFDLEEARDSAIRSNVELRKYFRAIEQSGNSIVITDNMGNIEYVNPMFEKVSGYALEEILGKTSRILKSGEQSSEFYVNLWNTISSGQVWTGTFHNKKKDGALYWESSTIAPVMDQNGAVINYVAIKDDITARRQAEEQLRKLSQAVEQSGNTVIIMDRNGLIEYVNPKFTEVSGYLPEEAIGKPTAGLMQGLSSPPDFHNDEWWLTVHAGRIWYGEFQNHRKDGSIFWESATIAPVQDSNGEIINFVEIKQDVTEQKILQEQIQRQNDYLSILHQVTLDLLNRRNLDNLLQTIVERSAAIMDASFCELRLEKDGYLVAEAFTGNQPYPKGDRASREEAKLSWQAFDTRQPVMIEDYAASEYRRKIYSNQAWHATVVFPIMAGERCLGTLAVGREKPGYVFLPEQVQTGILFTQLVALTFDNASLYDSAMNEIAERKRAESMLQESEARFRQIVENASDIIYRTDTNGYFTYANPSALRMMGYASEQEVLGRNYLDLTTPEYRHKLKRVYERQYLSRTMTTYYEFPAVTMDGQIVWVGQNVQLIMDGEQIIGFQAVARNITQLRQAQEALALSRDQALEASQFKSQLLSRVSHELRTPLGGILGYAELLNLKAFGTLTDKQKNAVNNIIDSTHYLTRIVNDLLDEAQIESRSLTVNYEHFAPSTLLEKVKVTMSVLAAKKGLTFRTEISPELPGELYGDVNRLQQIMVNLVGNAVKFTNAGEVSLRLCCPIPAKWNIEVRDTGMGIPIEEQKNIFEPFRQINNALTRENRGSGLGLAITKQIVELMGGQVNLDSEPGKGSLFTIILPIINAPEDK